MDLQDDFPVLDGLTYLNTASIGLVPNSVIGKAHHFEAQIAGRGTAAMNEETETAVFESARRAAASLLNAPIDNVALTSSSTEALCQIAWWLRPRRGENVVSIEREFPSVVYPWYRIAEDTGMEVRLARPPLDGSAIDLDRVLNLVDSGTRAVCVSHVQYFSGERMDLGRLSDVAHAHGSLLIVDASQSAGQVPLDVQSSGIDVLVAGAYKFLCGTFGAAICYLSPGIMESFKPPFVGWRSVIDPFSFDARYKPLAHSAKRMEFSTTAYAAAIALGAACDYIRDLDPAKILEHNSALAARLIDGLEEYEVTLATPRDPSARAGIVTARFAGHDGPRIASEFEERGVVVSSRGDATRFSFHFYNTAADVDEALAVVDEIALRP